MNTKCHHGDELSAVVFKMSDKPEGSDSHLDSREEENGDNSKSRSLKSATHKLKAEALRRLQLENAEYDSEGAENNEGREGSSSDKNAADTGKDDVERNESGAEKSDVLNKEKENNVDVTDLNGADANAGETRENEGFGKDSAKPNEDFLGDSVVGGSDLKSDQQNGQKSEISGSKYGQKDSRVSDQIVNKESGSYREGENVNQGISEKTSNEDSTPSDSLGQGGAARGSRPDSASSRKGSGRARPGSGSAGSRKGEGSQQKPSSRPGSGSGNRSRPGSGSNKVSGGGGQEQQPSSGRPGSGTGVRSRPQSGSKRGALGSEGETLAQDGSASGSVGEDTSKTEEASEHDGMKQTAIKDKVEGDASVDGKATSSDSINEGASQTLDVDSTEQGKDYHGDKSNLGGSGTVKDNDEEKSLAQKLSDDNISESKLTGGDDKISDDVSPPMNEGTESKDQGVDTKQSSDSVSNTKQDSEGANAGKDLKGGELPGETKGDKETTNSSDQQGQDDAKSSEQKDASEVLQAKDGSKDGTAAEGQEALGMAKTGDKDGAVTESGVDGKAKDGDAAKSGSGDAEGDKSGLQTDHAPSDKDDVEKSSDKQTAEEGKTGDAAANGAEEKKDGSSEKKKKKKKAKKEGAEQEENMEDEDEEEADETDTADGEAQPVKPKQTQPGS